jgi:hypothetical protein
MSDILHTFATFWLSPSGALYGSIVSIALMCALLGFIAIGESDDPTDF